MYLRCDGILEIDVNGYAKCDNFVSVSTSELLGDALQSHKLSEADYYELGTLTTVILLGAFGVKMVLQVILDRMNPE